jgi:hypothetical protein
MLTVAGSVLTRRSFLANGTCMCCTCAPLARSFAAISRASIDDLGPAGLPSLLELGTEPMKRIGQTVWVAKIAPRLWLHGTTAWIPGNDVLPANGVILERPTGSVLIDTGYTADQAELLLRWSKQSLSSQIALGIVTHFHPDRNRRTRCLEKARYPRTGLSADLQTSVRASNASAGAHK